ncbi:beta-glucan synthesis-associated [Amylocystis lapponica]|nr:beta-glucan synthesis-associated [Amylocystis lapponica]
MASLGPNSQRGYTQQQNLNSPSRVNLLSHSGPSSGVQAAFSPSVHSMASNVSPNDARYGSDNVGGAASISDKFSLSPDPAAWGDMNVREADDDLHNPDPRRDRNVDKGGYIFTGRGVMNLGCLFILAVGMLTLFAGYPIISYFTRKALSTQGGFNLGGLNASGQVPTMAGNWGLVDIETPIKAHNKPDRVNGKKWQLVFSDEFNTDGRTFWPGDDPYWEALNQHYWQTNNLEWLDPSAIVTKDGWLQITMSQKENHQLNYTSGMMSSWNKFCFTGGYVETSVILPGANNVVGFWPAVWTMGNLGRAGFGASLEGMWPYSYDACDVGTAPNQTKNGLPLAATENGDAGNGGVLSYLAGQKLSRCSCPGSSHPGPMHQDGTFVGRSAPEIDMFEATYLGTDPPVGQVSQSSQWGPFNYEYQSFNGSGTYSITNDTLTAINGYKGGIYQQAISALTFTDPTAYELNGMNASVYGLQYKPGFDDAYIAWIARDELVWTLYTPATAADNVVEISARPIPQEPMYIIMNLGISPNFGTPDIAHLTFPSTMYVDYIRVYQDPDNINIGCDPSDFPTAAYINEYIEAYTNPNLTTWRDDYGQPFPGNKFLDQC